MHLVKREMLANDCLLFSVNEQKKGRFIEKFLDGKMRNGGFLYYFFIETFLLKFQ